MALTLRATLSRCQNGSCRFIEPKGSHQTSPHRQVKRSRSGNFQWQAEGLMVHNHVHHPFRAPLEAASELLPAILIEPKGSHQTSPHRQIKRPPDWGPFYLAEREGFEPSMELLTPYSLSRGAPSASRPSLRVILIHIGGPERPMECVTDCTDFFPYKQKNFAILSKVFLWRRTPSFREHCLLSYLLLFRLFSFNAFIDLLTVHCNIARCVNADTHLIAFYTQNGDGYIVTNH